MVDPTPIADLIAQMRAENPQFPPPLTPDQGEQFRADLLANVIRPALVGALGDVVRLADDHANRVGAAGRANLYANDRLALLVDALFQLVTGSILTPEERRRIGLR